eukprot:1426514-Rhodomonas_salina.3
MQRMLLLVAIALAGWLTKGSDSRLVASSPANELATLYRTACLVDSHPRWKQSGAANSEDHSDTGMQQLSGHCSMDMTRRGMRHRVSPYILSLRGGGPKRATKTKTKDEETEEDEAGEEDSSDWQGPAPAAKRQKSTRAPGGPSSCLVHQHCNTC